MDGTELDARTQACPQCGGDSAGLVCDLCGALTRTGADEDAEIEGVDALGRLLRQREREAQVRLLDQAFVPRQPRAVVEAALQCWVLMQSESYGSDGESEIDTLHAAAARRLDTLLLRMRTLPPEAQLEGPIEEFSGRLERWREQDRQDRNFGCILCAVLLLALSAAVGGLLWWWTHQ